MKTKSLSHKKNNAPVLAAHPEHLGGAVREAVTAVINPLIADAFVLYIKTKNFHWHVSGPHFRDYHLLFDAQAEQVLAMIDVLAERVRKLGGATIRSIDHIAQLQHLKDEEDTNLSTEAMVHRLLEDNREYVVRLLDAHDVCNDHEDVATASVLEVFIDETEQRIWFLRQTLAPS